MTSRRKTRRRRVKAWAIVHYGTILRRIGGKGLYVFGSRVKASERKHYIWGDYPGIGVVPCTITFEAVTK